MELPQRQGVHGPRWLVRAIRLVEVVCAEQDPELYLQGGKIALRLECQFEDGGQHVVKGLEEEPILFGNGQDQ